MCAGTTAHILECMVCGQRQRLDPGAPKGTYQCQHCGHLLQRHFRNWYSRSLALVLAGVLLFLLSNLQPFLSLDLLGIHQQVLLLTGVQNLLDNEQALLALVVFGTIFGFPLVELACLLYVLWPSPPGSPLPGQLRILRLLRQISRWNLMEVFLLGAVITAVKLADFADLQAGWGLVCFCLLVVVLIAAQMSVNRRALWARFNPRDYYQFDTEPLSACRCCTAMVSESLQRCPRCDYPVKPRIHRSLEKTAALLLASVIFYIPANLLPMMVTTHLGQARSDTIFTGVLVLMKGDTWPLAVIVFVASLVVPVSKILVLAYLWWTVKRQSNRSVHHRAKLYHWIELVGHWSMVDVYVVMMMVALVQFGMLANIEAGGGALAFAAVVILTMLAAHSFDPRMIWDTQEQYERNRTSHS